MIKKVLKVLKLYKTPYQRTKKHIVLKLKTSGIEETQIWLETKIQEKEFQALHVHRILFSLWKNSHPEIAIVHGERAQYIEFSSDIHKVLKNRKRLVEKRKYGISQLKEFYSTHSVEETMKWMRNATRRRPDLKMQLNKTFFILAKRNHPKLAVDYGEKAVILGADKKFRKVLNTRKRWLEDENTPRAINVDEISVKETKLILDQLQHESLEEAVEYINSFKFYDENIVLILEKYLLGKIHQKEFRTTVDVGLGILDRLEDKALLKVIAARAYALKEYENAFLFYKKYFMLTKDKSILDRFVICIANNINLEEIDTIDKILSQYFNELSKKKKVLVKNKILFEIYFNESAYNKAVEYGLKIILNEKNRLYSLKLSRAYFELGKITKALKNTALDKMYDKHNRLMEIYTSYLFLKENGFVMPSVEGEYKSKSSKKVLYVLNNSLPYHSNGYSTRAHGLLEGAKKFKDIHAITRLGYPHDLVKFREEKQTKKHRVDEIQYFHLPSEDYWLNYMVLDKYLIQYGERLVEHIKKYDISLVHSASNFVNGLAANYAAKKLNVKSIYEVRGLWEITRISRQPEWENSEHFEMIKRLEIEAAKSADIVVTITHELKKELVHRGVNEDTIFVLPNGVNTDSFQPLSKDLKLMKELDIKDHEIVIGYIGSIVEYEGIDLLVEAIAKLKEKNIGNFKFLLVGDGRYFETIKKRITELKVDDLVIITGRIPHDDVEQYYSLIDIAPLPRKALPVSEMVSPLKPFEAMAMEKIVLGSDVAAIAEIIEDGYNGILFKKSNIEDLAEKLELLLKDDNLRMKIGKNARNWVVKERDWAVLAEKLNDIYNDLLEKD